LLAAPLVLSGCFPPMANMQGPEIGNRGRVTAHYSVIENAENDDADRVDAIGLLVASPAGDNAEIQVRFDYFRPRDSSADGDDIAFIGIGPKLRAFSRHLAFVIPAGIYVGSVGPLFEAFFLPGLIAGVPLHPRIEPIGAMRVVLPLDANLERYAIANLGLRLSPLSPKWMIIPEMGFAWGSETDARFESLAIGFAWAPP
jgi:hypothetical protein